MQNNHEAITQDKIIFKNLIKESLEKHIYSLITKGHDIDWDEETLADTATIISVPSCLKVPEVLSEPFIHNPYLTSSKYLFSGKLIQIICKNNQLFLTYSWKITAVEN